MKTPRSRLSGLGIVGDFTASPRMLLICVMAAAIGLVGAGFAEALLRLIAFFTNVFFYQRLSDAPVSPSLHHLGAWVILVPVVGFTIVGFMARYGSEKIRGHGIPEALEAILLRGSRAEPRLVVLKPVATAISIGAGGPFGAEGPIIVTTGSFGSIVAQLFNLTDQERKTLLVSGAAAGMAAIFATPLAATLLGVELLLFEWKPRSLVPVAIASLMGFAARQYLLGPGPLFPVPPHPAFVGFAGLAACVVALAIGGLIGFSISGATAYYRTPAGMNAGSYAPNHRIRVAGVVVKDSVLRKGAETSSMGDGKATLAVTTAALLPDTFESGVTVVAEGAMTAGGVFTATDVLAKCPSKFSAKVST